MTVRQDIVGDLSCRRVVTALDRRAGTSGFFSDGDSSLLLVLTCNAPPVRWLWSPREPRGNIWLGSLQQVCGDEWHYNSRCQERRKRVIVFKTFQVEHGFRLLLRKIGRRGLLKDTGMRIALHFCKCERQIVGVRATIWGKKTTCSTSLRVLCAKTPWR